MSKLHEIVRQLRAGDTWDAPEECFAAHQLTPEEEQRVCDHLAGRRALGRPGDGSDQPTLGEEYGFSAAPRPRVQMTMW